MLTMFAEVKIDGQWHKVGKEFCSTYEELEGQLTDRVYDGRDHQLISFLCAQSRSFMPDDVSVEIRDHKYFQEDDIHFATLRDILDFEWDKEVYKSGYISEWQYKHLKKNNIKPSNIFMDVFRSSNMVVSPFFMDIIIANPSIREEDVRYYVEYKYDHCLMKDACKFFCNVSIPALIKLVPDGGTINDVRIIFSIT